MIGNYVEVQGIRVPTRRRAYVRGPDYRPVEDLLMVSILRFLRHTSMVADRPVLAAYQARCEARPAFRRALAAQLAHFEKNAPVAA